MDPGPKHMDPPSGSATLIDTKPLVVVLICLRFFACPLLKLGSGSALIWISWVWIRIGNAVADPGAMNLTKITNKPQQLFKKTFVPT
jgi:hypothetical protein